MRQEKMAAAPLVGEGDVMEVVLTRTDKHEFVGVGRMALEEDEPAVVDSGEKLSEVWRRIAENLAGREVAAHG